MISGVATKNLIKHHDQRGYFEELIRVSDDFFQEGFGQLSHSLMKPGVIKAWHIHKTQTDWWYVVRGTLKTVLFDLREDSKTQGKLMEFTLGEKGKEIILKIPPKVAHGCKVLDNDLVELIYVTSGQYDPLEEGRLPFNDHRIGYDWAKEQIIKG